MTVYNINQGIGWASSGVEYAQLYRSQVFQRIGVDAKFVFTDFISNENIEHFTAQMGFQDDQVIWLYTYFTDFKTAPTTFTVDDLLKAFRKAPVEQKQSGNTQKFYFNDGTWATAYFKRDSDQIVDRVEYVSGNNLIRKDFYSYGRYMTEYYAPKDNAARLYLRRFYNVDGSIAYDEIVNPGQASMFKFKDQIIDSKAELISHFMRSLHLTAEDVVLIDRATGQAQQILENKGSAKVGTIVHADHFSEPNTNDNTILWNNYYEYEFQHYQDIDFYVTATDAQNQLLQAQFAKYNQVHPKIYTIPVGNLPELKTPTASGRRPYSLVTASRLASEKHVDWIVRAVAKAHAVFPEITLDIYGTGGEQSNIQTAIDQTNSGDYVSLKGHQDMTDQYRDYDVYVAASTSEGFGLTLMEAVGSGLAMVGFDVRYGNQTFIDNNQNGILIPYTLNQSAQVSIDQLGDALIKLFQESNFDRFHERSYEIAGEYLTERIGQRWLQLLTEVSAHD